MEMAYHSQTICFAHRSSVPLDTAYESSEKKLKVEFAVDETLMENSLCQQLELHITLLLSNLVLLRKSNAFYWKSWGQIYKINSHKKTQLFFFSVEHVIIFHDMYLRPSHISRGKSNNVYRTKLQKWTERACSLSVNKSVKGCLYFAFLFCLRVLKFCLGRLFRSWQRGARRIWNIS
jgi:hypothetical protein